MRAATIPATSPIAELNTRRRHDLHDARSVRLLDKKIELPEAGMEVDMGNFIECRIELGPSDPGACDNAVGVVCAP